MAVVVEISNTQHLAFSPLNEKHNILYNRARHIFNQRFIQKPWFDLNPFLDKADEQNIDIDNFVPDDYKGVQPLQSLCVVEDYFSNKPLLTKEFGIGEFWDYLFSSDWSEGHSVRVLDGYLHELIVSTLVQLIQSREVVQHSTFAYAKNKRPKKTSVYTHSNKTNEDPNLGYGEETLLVEFIYYGHEVNRETDESSVSYAGSSTTFPYATSMSEEIESSDQETQYGQSTTVHTIPETLTAVHPPTLKDKHSETQQKRFRRRVHYGQDVKSKAKATSFEEVLSRQAISRSMSKQMEENGLPPLPLKGIPRKETQSNFSSGSDYGNAPPTLDLKKFTCTEKIRYLGEFDLESDSSSEDEGEGSYGQEFYLGDFPVVEKSESVETMLRKRKVIVAKIKSEWKKMIKEYKPPKSMLPELSELVISKYLSTVNLTEPQQEEEKVPDLGEYIAMLKEDERYDPTLGPAERERLRIIKTARKYNLIKPENERFADEVGGVTDSVKCKLHCYDRDMTWRSLKDTTKRNYLLKKLMDAGGKVDVKPKKKKKHELKKLAPFKIPVIFITTANGITFVHPDSKLMLQKQRREELKKLAATGFTRRTSLLPTSPTALKKELDKKRRSRQNSIVDSVSQNGELSFPKAEPLVTGIESPDIDSDDESDELSDSLFDNKKLNINFSIEKIKTKKANMKKKADKRFRDVLKKYYRMQSVIKAFTPKPSLTKPKQSFTKPRSSLTTTKPSLTGGRRLSMPAYPSFATPGTGAQKSRKPIKKTKLKEESEECIKETVTIGKLKKFRFLEAKTKIKPVEDVCTEESLFDVYPMHEFRINTERALAEFVVRREIVVSNISTKKSVSITFTKKSVFTKSKFSCD